jgi:hypothetical protein
MSDQEPSTLRYTGFEVSFRLISAEAAAQMAVSPLFQASGQGTSTALLFDAILHTDYQKRIDLPGGFSYYKKKGSGLRIALRASGLNTRAALSFASVAAQATLKTASAEYRMHGLGLPDDVIASLLTVPLSGELSSDTYRALQSAISTSWPAYLRSNKVGVSEYAVPIPSYQDQPATRTRAINYAASMIAQRKSLVFAEKNRPPDVPSAVVVVVYARFLGSVSTNSKQEPSPEQAAQASRWLATGAII